MDADGYPTEEELKALDEFEGTLADFLEYLHELWWDHSGWRLDPDDKDPEWTRLELANGHALGNRYLIGRLQESVFWDRFWESSHRGGGYVFAFPTDEAEVKFHWGSYKTLKVAE